MQWYELKNWLELSTGLDRDALHIYAGIGIQLVVALILRRSLASPVPWGFVMVAAFANEYFDYTATSGSLAGNAALYEEAYRDIWNTLLLPSLFLMIARFWPNWLIGKARSDEKIDMLQNDRPRS
ncbi:MAG: hypothetical protein ABJF89_10055 [Parasphingorhabdus sp.]|uniref:hypothetical protein n=1 Tax=Parasphingorhabdus sp. TaxID=2709688 RepID=UPI0032649903